MAKEVKNQTVKVTRIEEMSIEELKERIIKIQLLSLDIVEKFLSTKGKLSKQNSSNS